MKYNYKSQKLFTIELAKEMKIVFAFYRLIEQPGFSEGKFINDLYISGGIELVSKYIKFVETGEHSDELLREMQNWHDNHTYGCTNNIKLQ